MTSENAAVAAATDKDPVAALAQAILDGRVRVTGGDWTDRDGDQRWEFTVHVDEP